METRGVDGNRDSVQECMDCWVTHMFVEVMWASQCIREIPLHMFTQHFAGSVWARTCSVSVTVHYCA